MSWRVCRDLRKEEGKGERGEGRAGRWERGAGRGRRSEEEGEGRSERQRGGGSPSLLQCKVHKVVISLSAAFIMTISHRDANFSHVLLLLGENHTQLAPLRFSNALSYAQIDCAFWLWEICSPEIDICNHWIPQHMLFPPRDQHYEKGFLLTPLLSSHVRLSIQETFPATDIKELIQT